MPLFIPARIPRRCSPSTGARAGGSPSRWRASPGRDGPGNPDRSGEARVHGPQPRDDRSIAALRPAVSIPAAVVAVPIAAPVPVSPVVAGPGPGAVGVRRRGDVPGQAAPGVDRRRRDRNAGPPRGRGRGRVIGGMIRRRGHPQLDWPAAPASLLDSRLGVVHPCLRVIGPRLGFSPAPVRRSRGRARRCWTATVPRRHSCGAGADACGIRGALYA